MKIAMSIAWFLLVVALLIVSIHDEIRFRGALIREDALRSSLDATTRSLEVANATADSLMGTIDSYAQTIEVYKTMLTAVHLPDTVPPCNILSSPVVTQSGVFTQSGK